MSTPSEKYVKKLNYILGGPIADKLGQKMSGGELIIMLAHLTGKSVPSMLGCIKMNGIATMLQWSLTTKFKPS